MAPIDAGPMRSAGIVTCVVQDPLASDVTVLRVRGPNPEEYVACGPLAGSWSSATTPPEGAGQCDPLTVTLWPTTGDVELRCNSALVLAGDVADLDGVVRGVMARAAEWPAVVPPQPAAPSAAKKTSATKETSATEKCGIWPGPPKVRRRRIANPPSTRLSSVRSATTAPHATRDRVCHEAGVEDPRRTPDGPVGAAGYGEGRGSRQLVGDEASRMPLPLLRGGGLPVHAELAEESVAQGVEWRPTDPARPGQIDRRVEADPALAQHEDPVGQ